MDNEIVSVTKRKPYTILTLEVSELNSNNVNHFNKQLQSVYEQGEDHIIINFQKLRFINSSAISIIAVIRKKLNEKGGVLKLVIPFQQVQDVIRMTGLHTLVQIVEDLEDCFEQEKLDHNK